jgi:tetratricopeptide (TPR) repeat protein
MRNMKWIKFISIYILVLVAVTAFAQQERKFIRKGNKLFEKENYQESEIQYRKAIDKDKNSYSALFNIGDALYKQQKYEDATKHFNDLSGKQLDKEDKAKLYHNIGNSMLQNQKLKESIEAYKEALRNNPNDMDTKYNLAYAQKMMQQQQQQQDQKKDQQDKDKDKNEDKKDQNKDQQNQNQQDKKNQQQQQQQQQQQISKEDAERLLQALANDEKKTQDKLKDEKAKAAKARVVKEW